MDEDEPPIEQRYFTAVAALDRGEIHRARQAFEVVTLIAPEFAPGWDGLARTLVAEGEHEKADRCFRRACRTDRRAWLPRYHWGLALFQAGELVGAAKRFREATKLAPRQREPWFALARVSLDQGHPDTALRNLERALQATDGETRDAEVLRLTSRAESARGDLHAAQEALSRACLLSPNDDWIYHDWALLAERQGRREEACRLAARAAGANPREQAHTVLRWRLLPAADQQSATPLWREIQSAWPCLAQALLAEREAASGLPERSRISALSSLRIADVGDENAVEGALRVLRELAGEEALCDGYRYIFEVDLDGETVFYRRVLVAAPSETLATNAACRLQEALDPLPYRLVELERIEWGQTTLVGVQQMSVGRVPFPRPLRVDS